MGQKSCSLSRQPTLHTATKRAACCRDAAVVQRAKICALRAHARRGWAARPSKKRAWAKDSLKWAVILAAACERLVKCRWIEKKPRSAGFLGRFKPVRLCGAGLGSRLTSCAQQSTFLPGSPGQHRSGPSTCPPRCAWPSQRLRVRPVSAGSRSRPCGQWQFLLCRRRWRPV